MTKLWFQFALKVVALVGGLVTVVGLLFAVPLVAGLVFYNLVVLGALDSFVKWLIGMGVIGALAAGLIGLWSVLQAGKFGVIVLRDSALTVLVPPWVAFPPGSLRDTVTTREGKRTLRRMAALYDAEPEAVLVANDSGMDIELLAMRLERTITAGDVRAAGSLAPFRMEDAVMDTHTGGEDDV